MKRKVIFFIGGLNFGGMERVVFIARELLEKKYDIKIVTLYQDAADYDLNNNYYNLDVPPSKGKLVTFIKRLALSIKMKNELKPDVVFSFGMYLNYLNILSNYVVRKKPTTIVGIRSYDWLTEPFFSAKTDRWIMNHADKVNCVSKLIANDAEAIWGIPRKDNVVIYNPYDLEFILDRASEIVDDFVFEKSKYYIITMGRLSNQKGYNHLIRAFSEVAKRYSNTELIILGNGEKKHDMDKMIYEYGLSDKVKLLGGKKNPYKYVKKANLYVLSSLAEGFPNALVEAMCLGIPIVSVNCKSGPSEILVMNEYFDFGNKNYYVGDYGILSREITPDKVYRKKTVSLEEKALVEAICYAYENRDEMLNLATKAQKHIRKFNYEKFYKSMVEILK